MKSQLLSGRALDRIIFRSVGLLRIEILVLMLLAAGSIPARAQQGRRIPGQGLPQTGSVAGTARDDSGRGLPGVTVQVRSRQTSALVTATTDGEGIYRLNNLGVGDYDVAASRDGFAPASTMLTIRPGELEVLDFQLKSVGPSPETSPRIGGLPGPARTSPLPPVDEPGSYPVFRMPEPENTPVPGPVELVPNEKDNFLTDPYRWTVDMPTWERYPKGGDFPYVQPHWYDPFNRNRLKGDEPIFGQ
jgi:Carboxypeptidase regulatory-like domain